MPLLIGFSAGQFNHAPSESVWIAYCPNKREFPLCQSVLMARDHFLEKDTFFRESRKCEVKEGN